MFPKKVISLLQTAKFSKQQQNLGKTVGLVMGGFDILHMGHINLFRFAKKYADILIVGLDNDQILKNTKGKTRPINNFKRRSEFLSEISLVDKIFKIDEVFKSGDKTSFKVMTKLLKIIKPTHVFSSVKCDNLWQERKKMANSLGIKFVAERTSVTHTSDILKIIESEL